MLNLIMPSSPTRSAGLDRLLAVMARLRDPEHGCPWDLAQSFASIAPYTIEEAYEVADAIRRGDPEDLRDELGDLLLQVAYHARLGEEAGHFDFDSIAHGIADKMIRRHPHVFGASDGTAAMQGDGRDWEQHKAAERTRKAAAQDQGQAPSALDGVARALPALSRAEKLQRRAARDGFDWPEASGALAKVDEELAELRAELDSGDAAARHAELGDLLFAVANAARKLGLDPEAALRAANDKFERRYRAVEARLAVTGRHPGGCDLAALEAEWQAVKAGEHAGDRRAGDGACAPETET